ncbi:MAG: response regulator [Deltaproteobacteria bacterium]|nr:response regulator [Deltaproteobacteria bacterium]
MRLIFAGSNRHADMVTRVLVVDDDLEIGLMMRRIFESRGVSVSTAPNGREALRIAERDRPDVIFLDIMMPGMDGVGVLAELRRRPELDATRVIMLTARGEPKDGKEADRIGADGYITKPFAMAQLLASVGLGVKSEVRP